MELDPRLTGQRVVAGEQQALTGRGLGAMEGGGQMRRQSGRESVIRRAGQRGEMMIQSSGDPLRIVALRADLFKVQQPPQSKGGTTDQHPGTDIQAVQRCSELCEEMGQRCGIVAVPLQQAVDALIRPFAADLFQTGGGEMFGGGDREVLNLLVEFQRGGDGPQVLPERGRGQQKKMIARCPTRCIAFQGIADPLPDRLTGSAE